MGYPYNRTTKIKVLCKKLALLNRVYIYIYIHTPSATFKNIYIYEFTKVMIPGFAGIELIRLFVYIFFFESKPMDYPFVLVTSVT